MHNSNANSARRPERLSDLNGVARWVFYSGRPIPTDDDPDKIDKAPLDPNTGDNARNNDPTTWSIRKSAERMAKLSRGGGKSGVGVVLGDLGYGFCLNGVDLDRCLNSSGIVEPWAEAIIQRLGSYSEISPSGTGIKIIYLCRTEDTTDVKQAIGNQNRKEWKRESHNGIELHLTHSYFTVTGKQYDNLIDETPLAVVPKDDVLWLVNEAGPAFKGEAEKTTGRRDGSAELFRLAGEIKRRGGTKEDFIAAIPGSPDAARHVKSQGKNARRAIDRAWERASGGDLTEKSVADAFVAFHEGRLLFNHDRGQWLAWDSAHWRPETTMLAYDFAVQACADAVKAEPKSSQARVMGRASSARGVEAIAKADRAFAVTSDRFDQNPWHLGTPAGTVELNTGELRPARQDDYITKLTAVGPIPLNEFDAERDCPRFTKFLDDATGGDADLKQFLQGFLGYGLSGDTREEALLFGHGPGGSGKSTLINTVGDLLNDYCVNIPIDTLTESKYDRHPTEIARLHGARMAWASETEAGRRWAQKRLTELTGGDKITARFMRADFFSFKPQFKLVIIGNNQPSLRNVDAAIKRRFNIVPFRHRPKKVDNTLKARLREEWPGILSWLILGCLDWQKRGLIRPKVVVDYTREYMDGQDTFQRWLDDQCEVHRAHSEASEHLWESWSNYARREGEDPGTKTQTFPDLLRERGFVPDKHVGPKRSRGWKGLRLRPDSPSSDFGDVCP